MNTAKARVILTVLEGSREGRVLPTLPLPFLIGRAAECHLRPASDAINLHHCVIEDRQGRPVVRDLASGSGTFVNDLRLTTDYPLFGGDELRVGPLRFRVGVDYPHQGAEELDDDVLTKLVVRGGDLTQTEPVSDALTQGGAPRPVDPPTKVFERLSHAGKPVPAQREIVA